MLFSSKNERVFPFSSFFFFFFPSFGLALIGRSAVCFWVVCVIRSNQSALHSKKLMRHIVGRGSCSFWF